MSYKYLPVERETVLNTDDETKTWQVYTAQPSLIRKLKKLGIKPYWTEEDNGKIVAARYQLDMDQVYFKKPRVKKELTEAQRQALAKGRTKNPLVINR
jgi:hypothetical protein